MDEQMRKAYVLAAQAMAEITAILLAPAILLLGIRFLFRPSDTVFFILIGICLLCSFLALFRRISGYGKTFTEISKPSRDDGSASR